MDKITTDLERKLDRQLALAIEGLRKIERIKHGWQARLIAQAILDQFDAALDDEEEE